MFLGHIFANAGGRGWSELFSSSGLFKKLCVFCVLGLQRPSFFLYKSRTLSGPERCHIAMGSSAAEWPISPEWPISRDAGSDAM